LEDLDGPDSGVGVGVDCWFQHRETGAEAYANLDQTIWRFPWAGKKFIKGRITIRNEPSAAEKG